MNLEEPIGIIELDNLNLKCIIFKINDNKIEILSMATTQSEGIHNDVIVNLDKATNAIRLCIGAAEKKAQTSLKKINVVFEQPDFLCTTFSKHKKIDGSQIHKDDIEFLLKEAKKQLISNDKNQSIIHIFNYNYIVDKKTFVEEPIGVYADLLKHEITFVTTSKNNLKNINQAFNECDIAIEKLISKTFALGVKFLNNKDLQYGSAIIDFGFEKISLGLFKNLALVHSITFPFGTNHIIKDISKVCSLSLDESENIKQNIDFSFKNNQNLFDKNDYLKSTFFISSNYRKISKKLILDVIQARIDEIIYAIKKQLIVPGFNLSSGLKYFLTGEGMNLQNIDKYFNNFLGSNMSKLNKNNTGNEEALEEKFPSCFGALKIIKDGWETEAIPKTTNSNNEKLGFFDRFFRIIR